MDFFHFQLKHWERAMAVMAIAPLWLASCRTASVSTPSVTRQEVQQKSIVVLYDNDVHCAFEGYEKMAGLRDAIRDTAWCCLVSCGDFLQGGSAGAISRGQYIADIMKAADYTAITLGNHEFDFGIPRMKELLAAIGAPVTCCNLTSLPEGRKEYANFVLSHLGSLCVAFVGVTTPMTLYNEAYAFYGEDGKQTHELGEEHVYAIVQLAVDEARQAGAERVIVLAHVGEDDNQTHVTSHELVKHTRGIDAVLDGHTHSVVPEARVKNLDGKEVPISQTGTKFRHVGKLLIDRQGRISTTLLPMKELHHSSPAVKAATDAVRKEYDTRVGRVVCQSEVTLSILNENGKQAVRLREVNMGDAVADAYRYVTGAQIAMTNGGGIRASLKPGDVTYGHVIAALPYENYVEVLEVKGQKILDVLEEGVSNLPLEHGDFPQVSGMKLEVNAQANPRVRNVQVWDEPSATYVPLDPEADYTLATIDYCVTGGGFNKLLKDEKVLRPNVMPYSEAFIEYVTRKLGGRIGKEYARPQGRISVVE